MDESIESFGRSICERVGEPSAKMTRRDEVEEYQESLCLARPVTCLNDTAGLSRPHMAVSASLPQSTAEIVVNIVA